MYIIEYTKDGKTYTIHDPRLANNLDVDETGRLYGWAKYGASAAKLTQAVNSAGSLNFTIQPEHNAVAALAAMEGVVRVTDGEATVFLGRIIRLSRTFTNAVNCECEGALAFLNDSLAGQYTRSTTASAHMTALLNGQFTYLAEHKITMGSCTVTQSGSFANDDVSKSVWTCLMDDLVGSFGGYIVPRYNGDTVYIDYLTAVTAQSEQKVEFAVNLLDVTDERDGSGMYNCVWPYGAEGQMILSVENGYYNRAGQKVSEGASDAIYYKQGGYVINIADRNRYGAISIGYKKEDLTTAAELFADAVATLNSGGVMPRSIRISAVDLSGVREGIAAFRLATAVQAESVPHGLSVVYPLTEMEIDLLDPARSSLTLGQTEGTMSGAVAGGVSSGAGGVSSGAGGVDGTAIAPESVAIKSGETTVAKLYRTSDGRGVLALYDEDAPTNIAVQLYAVNSAGGGVVRNSSGKNVITFSTSVTGYQPGAGAIQLSKAAGGVAAVLGAGYDTGEGVLSLRDSSGAAHDLTPALIDKLINL